MSLTIVIADDEPFALKSEELFLKKEFPELEIIGKAENGIILKQILEERQPDLAIVDIRMPGLTGIEVIELMKSKGCKTHFMLNTAYSDFEYVKKALDLKTDGYLLKPSKRDEKRETISRMIRLVEEEKEKYIHQEGIASALDVVNVVLGSEILLSVFSEKPNEEGFQAYCRINNISFDAGCIATFLLQTKADISKRQINKVLEETLRGICNFLATVTSRGVMIMFLIPGEIEAEARASWCEELAEMTAVRLQQKLEIPCRYGTGNIYQDFDDMKRSYEESTKVLQVEAMSENEATASIYSADKSKRYIEKSKTFIENNYKKDISLSDCAEYVGISSYYLSHMFREQTKQTFVEYLSNVRMEHAKELSVTTDLTIAEIAGQCGYMNVTYFCKVFKRMTGDTIGSYRKAHKGE